MSHPTRNKIKELFRDTSRLPSSKFSKLVDGLWRDHLYLYDEQVLLSDDEYKIDDEDPGYDVRYRYEKNEMNNSWSTAHGFGHIVNADFAQVHGWFNQAEAMYETIFGPFATVGVDQTPDDWVETDRLFVFGNGENGEDLSDALTIYKSGYSVFENSIVIGDYSHGAETPENGSLRYTSENTFQGYFSGQWNSFAFGSEIIDTFIGLTDTPGFYHDQHGVIAYGDQIMYSQRFGSNFSHFWISKKCPHTNTGVELITNGDFDSGLSGWSGTTGWSVSDGRCVHTPGNDITLYQQIGEPNGGVKQCEIDIIVNAGSVTISLSGGTESYTITQSQLFEGYFNCTAGTRNILIDPSSDFDGSIDGITLKVLSVDDDFQLMAYNPDYSQAAFSVKYDDNSYYIGRGIGEASGVDNVAVVTDGLANITTAEEITVIGANAGATVTSESNLILIGTDADIPAAATSNWLNIGDVIQASLSAQDVYLTDSLILYYGTEANQVIFPDAVDHDTLVGKTWVMGVDGQLEWTSLTGALDLQNVTDNGNTTTNVISTAGYQVSGTALKGIHLTDIAALTTGYIPYWTGSMLDDSGVYFDSVNGRVGIGTTSLAAKLNIETPDNSIAIFRGTGSDSFYRIIIDADNGGDAQISFQDSSSTKWTIGNDGSDNDKFKIAPSLIGLFAGTEVFTIQSNGNVGIGTNNPAAYLHTKAGTATAGTAPRKYTAQANLLASEEEGTVEFDGVRWYGTDSTPTRNTFAWLSDVGGGLPSGTNGDILYYNSGWQVLAKGTDGDTLSLASGIPDWKTRWVEDTYGLTYTEGNIGIGAPSLGNSPVTTRLNIAGRVGINIAGSYAIGGLEVRMSDSNISGIVCYSTNGGYGIITSSDTYAGISSSSIDSYGGIFTSTNSYGISCSSARIDGGLSFLESTGATYYTTLQAGDQSADITYTLPTAYPAANGYALTSTTGGVMSWAEMTSSPWTADTYGITYADGNVGVGRASHPNAAKLFADGGSIPGLYGKSTNNYGVRGYSEYDSGIFGQSNSGSAVFGSSISGYGVSGYSGSNYSGYFNGGLGLSASKFSIGTTEIIDASGNADFNSLEIGGTTAIDSGGFFKPVSSANADAPNNSIYYSTDASKLVYKDSGGNVNALY